MRKAFQHGGQQIRDWGYVWNPCNYRFYVLTILNIHENNFSINFIVMAEKIVSSITPPFFIFL